MSKRIWTPQQQNAIASRGGTLLLSAAAGSGKTAVLVERIIKLLTDSENPVEPSSLLVVTFTNAAAQEMRIRIAAAIDALIKDNPTNNFYRSVKMKLPEATVSTIDSFCIRLVRENFHTADIEPDFKLLSSGENRLLMSQAMTKTLDEVCTASPKMYDMLNSMTSYGRDDSGLSSKILKLYEFSLAHPFPDVWLRSVIHMYDTTDDVKSTVWGSVILQDASLGTDYALSLIEKAICEVKNEPVIDEAYSPYLANAYSLLSSLKENINSASWDDIFSFIRKNGFCSLPAVKRGYGKNPVKLFAEYKYKKAAAIYEDILKNICVNTEDFNIDNTEQRPVISALVSSVQLFSYYFSEAKKEKNSYGFSDIMHKALELVAVYENGEIKKTPLAVSLANSFSEILIDEYQDTNEAQDMLFYTISSDGKNMFMVGDVKQSIYRFRLAMPEIFVKKSREFGSFNGKNYPAKIVLGKNFRSRKGILDNINFLFDRIMSEAAGEMDYTHDDALYFGDGYGEDSDNAFELRFLLSDSAADEAEYTAEIIADMIRKKTKVNGKNGERECRASDFCILMRSPDKKASLYASALTKRGIQCSYQKKTSLFDAAEVEVFMSLLKIINNPTDDVAMLAVMLSSIYGFTVDDVVNCKLPDKSLSLYSCLKKFNSEKARLLLSDIMSFRRMSAVMPFGDFVRTLLDLTGYGAIVGAMSDGAVRRKNLLLLCTLAYEFQQSFDSGISGFIRYISAMAEKGSDITGASDVSESADVVRIYSIHKSKGLEFPFVILADCSKKFNLTDASDDMIISTSAGVGMVMINGENLQKYSTTAHNASKIAVTSACVSEELRILYVALTRARERLIAVCSDSKIYETAEKLCSEVSFDKKPDAKCVLKANSYKNLLLLGFLNHPDMHELLREVPCEKIYKEPKSRLSVIIDSPVDYTENTEVSAVTSINKELMKKLKEKCEFRYPYQYPENARPKRVASEFENHIFKPEYFGKLKPSFALDGALSPAEAGTANHLFLQNLDFNAPSIEAELDRMMQNGILSEKQAASIRVDKMMNFKQSELFNEIKNADTVYREREFTVEIELGEIEKKAEENVRHEKIIILGKADLVFIKDGRAVVVDYKTDRSKTKDEFITAYSGQLDMYKRAISQVLSVPVEKSVIYSLELGEEIETQ